MENTDIPNEKGSDKMVRIVTEGGHLIILNDTDGHIVIQSKKGNLLELNDQNRSIVMSDASDRSTIRMDRNGITFSSKGEIKLESAKKVSVNTDNFDVSSNGSIQLKAYNDINITGMTINNKAYLPHKDQAMEARSKTEGRHSTGSNNSDTKTFVFIN